MTDGLLWQGIARALRAEIAAGAYAPGDRLPSEAELALRFGVNRHTLRRAVQALAEAGELRPRRGAGVFVAARPTEYPLGERVRFHQNLMASGRTPSRRLLHLETRAGTAAETRALALEEGAPVHLVEGLSLSDGTPVAFFRSYFPAQALPGFLEALRADASVTRALAACGVADYRRAHTRISAELAEAVTAAHLGLSRGAALLRTQSVNVDLHGRPVEYGITLFAGDRVVLTHQP